MDIEGIKEVLILRVKPGDRLAVKVNSKLSQKQYSEIKDKIKEWAGDIQVVLIPDWIELAVVREDGTEPE